MYILKNNAYSQKQRPFSKTMIFSKNICILKNNVYSQKTHVFSKTMYILKKHIYSQISRTRN